MKYFKKNVIEKLGGEYIRVLEEVLKIRESRRSIWKDSFLNENEKDLLVLIEGKIKRFKNTNNIIYKIDSLRDAINYIIFLLCVINKNNKKL